ncbi:hypothetical protein CRM22_008510 [Opisthorchis felineus]|uniref:Rho-GAP domain-containing protein n=1 Tax=Opisthorchis felineus TaxID=147828 RepID=A0A4S2LBK2_OPIFE|nr:hypothetical protein CRM22_008510 [Opisthorchis felineus]
MVNSETSTMQEPREIFRRFRPQIAPVRAHVRLRNHRSLFNLNRSSLEETNMPLEEAKKPPSKYSGLGRKVPRMFRWGGSKKATIGEPMTQGSGEPTRQPPEEGGFLGHLGIGHYIAADDNAFLNCESSEDTSGATNKGYSKSLVNLSSITPWSHANFDSVGILAPSTKTESDGESMSTSSNCDLLGASPALGTRPSLIDLRKKNTKNATPMPELIRSMFFTNIPLDDSSSTGPDTLTNCDGTSRTYLEIEDEPNAFLPALLITEASGIVPDKTYTIYQTSDYPGDLRSSIQWLEAGIKTSQRGRRSTRRRSPSVPKFAADLRTRRATPDGRRKSHCATSSPVRDGKSTEALNGPVTREPDFSEKAAPVLTKDEMKAIHTCLVKAYEKLEALTAGSKNGTSLSKTGVTNAWIIKSEPLSWHQSENALAQLVPELERPMQTTKELQKFYREEKILNFKIPFGWSDGNTELHDDNFRKSTLGLTTTHLFITESSIRKRSTHFLARFQYVLPLSQLWIYEGAARVKRKLELASFQNLITSSSAINPASENHQKAVPVSESESNADLSVSETDSEMLLIGCPPSENWIIRFPNSQIYKVWRRQLHDAISERRGILACRSLYVKILNQVADNQVVYKYLKVDIHTNVEELIIRALQSMNLDKSSDVQLLVRFIDDQGEQKEITLLGPENPFLIAVVLTYNMVSRMSADRSDSLSSSPTTSVFHTEPLDFLTKLVTDAVTQYVGTSDWDLFVSRLPTEDPLLPRDQVNAEFVLRAKEGTQKKGRRLRPRSMAKPSDLKKHPSNMSSFKPRKQKGELREKTKSSLALNDDFNKGLVSPLRGARSTGSLNLSSDQYEIFGRAPDKLWPDAKLPQSLVNLFVIIYHAGTEVEGIFRRSTALSQVQSMQLKVDANVEPINATNCPPLVAAGVLKRFFNEIPGHLLGDENWNEWVQVVRTPSVDERIPQMEALIKKLPKVNQTLLTLLIHLLAHIRDHEHLNRMSTDALGTVWGPNIIQRPNSVPNHEEALLATQIVVSLLHPQFTASILSDGTGPHRELLRYYQSIWQAMEAAQNELSYESTVRTSRTLSFRFSGLQEESSLASSIRSDASIVEDRLKKKVPSCHSPQQSNNTSSSAESQNASPVLTSSRLLHSPALTDRRQASYLPRRMLHLRPESVLPDQPASMRADTDSGNVMPQGNLSRCENPITTEKSKEAPPPIPPRTTRSVGTVIQMLPSKQRTEPTIPSTKSPVVLPRAKPRTKDIPSEIMLKQPENLQSQNLLSPQAPAPTTTNRRRRQGSRRKTLTVCYSGRSADTSSQLMAAREPSFRKKSPAPIFPQSDFDSQRNTLLDVRYPKDSVTSLDDTCLSALTPTPYQTHIVGNSKYGTGPSSPKQQHTTPIQSHKGVSTELQAATRFVETTAAEHVQRSPKSTFSPARDQCMVLLLTF